MLKDLFGDTLQVEVIEKIVKNNDDWNRFPSKEEIIDNLEIPKETIESFDEDFLKLVYLAKYKLSDLYKIIALKDEIDRILPDKSSFKEEFDEISKNYILFEEEYVKRFFTERYGLTSYVNHITPLINGYFPDYPKMIVYISDPEFDSLSRITIVIKSSEDSKEEDEKILKELKGELRNNDLFPRDIKFICSLELDYDDYYFGNNAKSKEYEFFYEIYGELNEKILEFL